MSNIDSLFGVDPLAFDIESTGTHMRSDVPVGFSVAGSAEDGYYVPIEDRYYSRLLSNKDKYYIGHNIKFDRGMAKKTGIVIDNVVDTMIAAHLMEESSLALANLVLYKTGKYIREYSQLTVPLQTMSQSELQDYFNSHARAAWILWFGYPESGWRGYEYELRSNIVWDTFWDIEMPLVPVLSDMELNGAAIDKDYLVELGQYFDGKIDLYEAALAYWSDKHGRMVNFNSPEQVAPFFYDTLGIKPSWQKTKSGRYTVEGKYLESIKDTHPILPTYLGYKHMRKLKGTYVDGISKDLVDGRIYGSFNQAGTRTSRLSSSDPNLQNIPARSTEGKKIRGAFIAPEGKLLVKADADQLELKMMAYCSQDKFMLDAFRAKRDIHLETAIRAWNDASRRRDGKTLNFQVQYGGGTDSDKSAFYGAYPGVLAWTNKAKDEARANGYVRTLFKRKRTIPELTGTGKTLEHGEREAISTIVQGSSAELVKIGMRKVWNDTHDTDAKMILQVHDEVVCEVSEKCALEFAVYLCRAMQYDDLGIPITYSASIGKNWRDMKEVVKGGELIKE